MKNQRDICQRPGCGLLREDHQGPRPLALACCSGFMSTAPKPDGWHTYHICGGVLRPLTWTDREAFCVTCNQAFTATVS